jgi:hypothetical protein
MRELVRLAQGEGREILRCCRHRDGEEEVVVVIALASVGEGAILR